MRKFKVAFVVGSNRRESINRKLAQAIAKLAENRVDAKLVQIGDLPMYNQDLESPLPMGVARFKTEIEQVDALVFVTPEHNRSLPAVLKNAIDWGTRPYGAIHGLESPLPSPGPRRALLPPRSLSSISVRFWATWGPSSWVARPIGPSSLD